MIKAFLIERRSWIAAFLFQQALMLFIVFVDPSISFGNVLYNVHFVFYHIPLVPLSERNSVL